MPFTYLLIIFALGIFAFVLVMLLWARKGARQMQLTMKPRSSWLFIAYCALAAAFVLFSAYSVIVGSRPLVWFFVFATIGMLALYFVNSSVPIHRRFSIGFVILLAVVESLTPMIQNRLVLINSDQWRDLRVTTYIMNEGTFQNAPGLGTGYYSFIPLFNVLNAEITQVTGWSAEVTFAFLQFAITLLSVISIYVIVAKLTGQASASIIAILLFLSTPRLSNVQVVPSTVGISLGFLLILLLVKENASSLRSVIILTSLLAFAVNIFHPVGMIPILALCLGIIVMKWVPMIGKPSVDAISFAWRILSVCLLITLAYWTADSRVFLGIFNPALRLIHIFTSAAEAHPSLYQPQYQGAGFELFSFAWALPVAFTAAYVLLVIMKRRGNTFSNSALHQKVVVVASFAGLLLILSALVTVVVSPGGGLEKYLNIPAYALLLLPSSFVFSLFLTSSKKIPIIIALLLLSASVVIGSRSPDWAPFESPDFGAFRSTFTSSIEANTLVTLVPNGARLYEDYDIPLAEVAILKQVEYMTDRNYDTTRKVVQMFEGNLFRPFDANYRDAVIVMKTDRIVNKEMLTVYINIVYSSGRHVVVVGL